MSVAKEASEMEEGAPVFLVSIYGRCSAHDLINLVYWGAWRGMSPGDFKLMGNYR